MLPWTKTLALSAAILVAGVVWLSRRDRGWSTTWIVVLVVATLLIYACLPAWHWWVRRSARSRGHRVVARCAVPSVIQREAGTPLVTPAPGHILVLDDRAGRRGLFNGSRVFMLDQAATKVVVGVHAAGTDRGHRLDDVGRHGVDDCSRTADVARCVAAPARQLNAESDWGRGRPSTHPTIAAEDWPT